MPRRPRIVLPNVPLHLIQRGNNRQACFFEDEDYQSCLQWLEEYSAKCRGEVHAFVLMTNHNGRGQTTVKKARLAAPGEKGLTKQTRPTSYVGDYVSGFNFRYRSSALS